MTIVKKHEAHDHHDGVPPLPPSPTRRSRFHFFSIPQEEDDELGSDYDDRKTNINALLNNETKDVSRRRNLYKNPLLAVIPNRRRTQQHYQRQHIISYRKGLIDIQRQVAAWHSRFAQEILDRNQDDYHHIPFTTKNLKRWNEVMDRMYQQMNQQFLFHNDNETQNHNTNITSMTLQQRMDRLHSLVRQHSDNITSITSSRNTIYDTWTVHTTSKLQQVIDEVHTLQMQSNKREEQMYARLYHIASLSEASWAETNAQREAQLTLLEEKIHNGSNRNQAKRQGFLTQIQQMKDQIRYEREERMKRDKEIIDMIVSHRTMLEKVMMLCLDL